MQKIRASGGRNQKRNSPPRGGDSGKGKSPKTVDGLNLSELGQNGAPKWPSGKGAYSHVWPEQQDNSD